MSHILFNWLRTPRIVPCLYMIQDCAKVWMCNLFKCVMFRAVILSDINSRSKSIMQCYIHDSRLHQDLNEQCGLNVLRCNSFCHQGTMAFPSQIWGKGHQKLRWDWKNTGYKNHFVAKNCNYHLFKLSVMESISLHLLVLHSSLASAIPMLDNGMGEKVSSSASYHHIHQNYHCHK